MKKKLNLKDLEVQSFVTALPDSNAVKGGTAPATIIDDGCSRGDRCNTAAAPPYCQLSLAHLC